MNKITYEIIQHDNGWAYKMEGSFSETFASHADAVTAATRAASEQKVPGETSGIAYQDKSGKLHEETVRGDDRPATNVVDVP